MKYVGNLINSVNIYILYMYFIYCFFRGKGDYYRLGYGLDDYVRRFRKVSVF